MEKSSPSVITPTDIEVIRSFTEDNIISIEMGKLLPTEQESAMQQSAQAKFRSLILRCVVACSIKTQPDEYTVALLWNYVSKSLSTCTFKEIETAVVYNAAGKLEQRVEHFQVFDLTFLSGVMDEWFILKSKTRNRVAALLPKPKEAEPETPETLYQGLLNYINKNNSFPEFWAWNDVYQHMDENDLIPQTNAEKTELFKEIEAKFRVKMELDLMEIRDFIERDALKSGHTERVKAECRKLTIQQNLSYLLNPQPHTKQPNCNETSNRDSNG